MHVAPWQTYCKCTFSLLHCPASTMAAKSATSTGVQYSRDLPSPGTICSMSDMCVLSWTRVARQLFALSLMLYPLRTYNGLSLIDRQAQTSFSMERFFALGSSDLKEHLPFHCLTHLPRAFFQPGGVSHHCLLQHLRVNCFIVHAKIIYKQNFASYTLHTFAWILTSIKSLFDVVENVVIVFSHRN